MGKTHLFFSLHSNATAKHVAVSDGAQGTAVSDAGHGMWGGTKTCLAS